MEYNIKNIIIKLLWKLYFESKTYKVTLRYNNYMLYSTLSNTSDSTTTLTRLHNLQNTNYLMKSWIIYSDTPFNSYFQDFSSWCFSSAHQTWLSSWAWWVYELVVILSFNVQVQASLCLLDPLKNGISSLCAYLNHDAYDDSSGLYLTCCWQTTSFS